MRGARPEPDAPFLRRLWFAAYAAVEVLALVAEKTKLHPELAAACPSRNGGAIHERRAGDGEHGRGRPAAAWNQSFDSCHDWKKSQEGEMGVRSIFIRSVLGLAVSLCFQISAGATEAPVFTFMGHEIGDAIEKHRRDFGNKDCNPANSSGLRYCRDENSLRTVGGNQYIGDIPIRSLSWIYIDNRLAGIDLDVTYLAFDDFTTMLSAKFGQPKIYGDGVVWRFRGGNLTFLKHQKHDFQWSNLQYWDEKATSIVKSRDDERKKEQGRKLF